VRRSPGCVIGRAPKGPVRSPLPVPWVWRAHSRGRPSQLGPPSPKTNPEAHYFWKHLTLPRRRSDPSILCHGARRYLSTTTPPGSRD
jgi:hypothetical protein